jgi:hypothetical protein
VPRFDRQLLLEAWADAPPVVEATHDWLIRHDGSTVLFFRR